MLATNIAETSLTIDGVRIVVDAGLERRSLFDPASGMNRLELQRISRASAEQRTGRAGRTAPGVCYRLWGEGAERSLAAYAPPEICVADLAPLALDLAVWGTEAAKLRWLDAPPAATLASARDLLRRLGALDAAGKVTRAWPRDAGISGASAAGAHDAEVAWHSMRRRWPPSSPRCCPIAICCAPVAGSERDSDVRTRLELLRKRGAELDRGALERVRRAQRSFLKLLGGAPGGLRAGRIARPCCWRWPIRIASAAGARAARAAISSRTAAARCSRAAESVARAGFHRRCRSR